MTSLFRLFMAAGASLAVLLIVLIAVAQRDANLMAPLNLLLFLLAIAVYLLPTVLAFFRDCESAMWIAVLNVFLGWTIFGWFIAMGWAAGGKIKPVPPRHPLPSH
jgi:hypothetical protein